MTFGEKAEQALTNRPNSDVPGKTLARLLGISPTYYNSHSTGVNWAMHWGQGIAAAGIRGVMSYYGIVGPFGSYLFMGVRLLIDQTLENWTGVGALPWLVHRNAMHYCELEVLTVLCSRTWPVNEQIIDLLHKGIFAAVTGYVADRLILGEALNA